MLHTNQLSAPGRYQLFRPLLHPMELPYPTEVLDLVPATVLPLIAGCANASISVYLQPQKLNRGQGYTERQPSDPGRACHSSVPPSDR